MKTQKKTRKSKSSPSLISKKADKLLLEAWKKIGKEKWGDVCEVCGSNKCVQGHHFYPKKHYPTLKFDVDNYVPLCRSHHFQLERLKRFDIMFQVIIGRGMKWLKKLHYKIEKI